MQVKDDADCTFISEVFAGCVRYQGLIKVQGYRHTWLGNLALLCVQLINAQLQAV